MGEQISQQPIKVIIDDSQITKDNKNSQIVNEPSHNSYPSILTKLHAGYFRICVSLGAQALLWKTLSERTDAHFFHHPFRTLPSTTFLFIWWLSLCTLTILSLLYVSKCVFKFKTVKAEFSDHVGVNYLFTPSISWLLLLFSTPYASPKTISYQMMWLVFVAPVVILDVKVYGQWFTTEKRFFSMFANPTSQMSVIANLVGAWVAAKMGWRESATFIFTLGASHYLVVFITLYQRLFGAHQLPIMMRPVFFLFVAAPSMGSLAWSSINGEFDTTCKMLFFLSTFLFTSLVCRPLLFKKSMKKFSAAWWAYSFPLTFLALASSEYAQQVKGIFAMGLTLVLFVFSVLVFLSLLVFTALNTDKIFRDNDDRTNCKVNDNEATKRKPTKRCKINSRAKEVLR